MKMPVHKLIFRPLGRSSRGKHYKGFASGRTIELDPRTTSVPLAKVYLHELIHLMHPRWSETRVLREEARRWKRLSWREKAELYRRLGKAVLKGE